MGVEIKLQAFEGPLDLLLHLIDKNKINIYDIPISEITDQYMEYLAAMNQKDLNIMSEFMLMASTLLDIKCRMLLPREINEEGEEEDPRDELVHRLLEYKMYKSMSYVLKDRQIETGNIVYRKEMLPDEVAAYRPPIDYEILLGDVTLSRLNDIFHDVIHKSREKIDPVRSKFGKIEQEEVNLDEKILWLKDYAACHNAFLFRELLEEQSSRMQIIVTFLAVLELIKSGVLTVSQEELFDEIELKTVKELE